MYPVDNLSDLTKSEIIALIKPLIELAHNVLMCEEGGYDSITPALAIWPELLDLNDECWDSKAIKKKLIDISQSAYKIQLDENHFFTPEW